MYTNRPYQISQLNSIEDAFNRGIHRPAISAATGTGKTVLFAQIPERMKKYLPGQTLVLENRNELLDQSIEKLVKANPHLKVGKEKAEHYVDVDSDIIVGSIQSLGRKGTSRVNRFNWNNIDKIITDEMQHSTSETYQRIYGLADVLRKDTHKFHLGVSATTQRADGKILATIFDEIVHTYSIRSAIQDGWLVDVKGIKVNTCVSLDDIKTVAGDFKEDELADTVNTPARNMLAVQSWLKHCKGRVTIAFTVDIQHAKDLADMFVMHGVKAVSIWGSDPDRDSKLEQLRKGEIEVITNCGILTEGFDCWRVSCILLTRPTRSSVLYIQMVGRGTRLEDGTGNLLQLIEEPEHPVKKDCIVIDLVDVSSKHSLITLPTLLGMSAALDLKGGSLVKAIQILEEKQEQYSHLDFSGLHSIDNLDSYIESVDLFSIKHIPEVDENSELIWQRSPGGGYILLLPNKEKVQIQQNLLDKWELSASIYGKRYKGERETLEDVFKAADELVRVKAPDVLKLVQKGQQWQKKAATVPQLNLLRKLFKGRALPNDLDSGTASMIIGRELAKRK